MRVGCMHRSSIRSIIVIASKQFDELAYDKVMQGVTVVLSSKSSMYSTRTPEASANQLRTLRALLAFTSLRLHACSVKH
jgi:hypothetical protein